MHAESRENLLLLGDVFGRPGRNALAAVLAEIVQQNQVSLVIANAENAAGGKGVTPEVADDLLALGVDVLTSGNHIWKYKEIRRYLEEQPRLLRPANYPEGAPGRGSGVFQSRRGTPVGVINLEGQLFMSPLTNPFKQAEREIENLRGRCRFIVVDFHAEATSEKRALGFYLDGRVAAVVGTHTHVQTADAQILPGGTGYITDLGMTGASSESVIGVRKEQAIERFLTHMPASFQAASGKLEVQGALIAIDSHSGRCLEISARRWPA